MVETAVPDAITEWFEREWNRRKVASFALPIIPEMASDAVSGVLESAERRVVLGLVKAITDAGYVTIELITPEWTSVRGEAFVPMTSALERQPWERPWIPGTTVPPKTHTLICRATAITLRPINVTR